MGRQAEAVCRSSVAFFLTFASGWVWVLHCWCIAAEASVFCGTDPEAWIRPVCNAMPLVGSWIVAAEAGRDAGSRIWAPACAGWRDSDCVMVWWPRMNWFWLATWLWSAGSSCLTSTGRPGELQDAVQFDGLLRSSLTCTGSRGLSWDGESPCWLLFSTSNCIFSSSTSLCSCSSFLISSLIWRSFSCSRLSFSESCSWDFVSMGHSSCGALCGELMQGAWWAGASESSFVGLSAVLLSSMPRLETLEAIGDTGGVNLGVSDCEIAASMGAAVWMLEFSWYSFSLSISSVLVPETGKYLSFNSIFSSATCKDKRLVKQLHNTQLVHLCSNHICMIQSGCAGCSASPSSRPD